MKLLGSTKSKFTSCEIYSSWQIIKQIYKRYLYSGKIFLAHAIVSKIKLILHKILTILTGKNFILCNSAQRIISIAKIFCKISFIVLTMALARKLLQIYK